MDDVRAVMDAVGSERAVIFGESEGGPMSILFAATYPERTIGLVLFGPHCWVEWSKMFEGAFRLQEFAELVEHVRPGLGPRRLHRLDEPARQPRARRRRGIRGKVRTERHQPRSISASCHNERRHRRQSIAGSVTVPTLIMHRTGDQVVKVQQGRWLADHIPGATYVEFEGDNHLMSAGDPEPILARTWEFVTGSQHAQAPDHAVATVLFTDIVDSTVPAAELGDGRWRSVLDRHEAIVARELNRHRARR